MVTLHSCNTQAAEKDKETDTQREWAVIVCDEVHTIKSPSSKMAMAMKKFKERRRIGMTGTILQNSYSEYWSVLDWVVPGMCCKEHARGTASCQLCSANNVFLDPWLAYTPRLLANCFASCERCRIAPD